MNQNTEQTESGNPQPFNTTYSGRGVTKRLKNEARAAIEAAMADLQSALELTLSDQPSGAVSRVVTARIAAEDARHSLNAWALVVAQWEAEEKRAKVEKVRAALRVCPLSWCDEERPCATCAELMKELGK